MHVEFYLKCQRHTDEKTDTETRIFRSILHNCPPLKQIHSIQFSHKSRNLNIKLNHGPAMCLINYLSWVNWIKCFTLCGCFKKEKKLWIYWQLWPMFIYQKLSDGFNMLKTNISINNSTKLKQYKTYINIRQIMMMS